MIGWLGQRWTAETGRASRDPAGQWVRTPQRLWLCGRTAGQVCPRPEPRAPPRRSTPWRRAAAAAQSGASPPPLPVAAGVSHSGTGFHRRVAGSRRCLQGRGWSAVQRPDVTPGAAGSGGHGSAAHLQWGRGTRARAAVLPMRTSCGRRAGGRQTSPAVGGRYSGPCRDLGPRLTLPRSAERRPPGLLGERPPYPDAWLG